MSRIKIYTPQSYVYKQKFQVLQPQFISPEKIKDVFLFSRYSRLPRNYTYQLGNVVDIDHSHSNLSSVLTLSLDINANVCSDPSSMETWKEKRT